ncbi:phosphoribosylanthranilate isomerase [Brackiella oedipodis]|uniref:phosphoribosylanthranilate isomerase n=1 Tax=Brackiella oedipodis TaxID=124225 RepID=UPI000490749D|nr:phosphoribosylanthranilate isomerase [Brackiella oedipodis]
MRIRVKICGITNSQDLHAAVAAGADALGFVMYPKSKRAIDMATSRTLISQVPFGVSSVVLCVNPSVNEVQQIMTELRPSYIQFHGDETASFCEQFNYPYIKAIRVGAPGLDNPISIQQAVRTYSHAKAILFDAFTPHYGGAGQKIDLKMLPNMSENNVRYKYILAGGINASNVIELVNSVQPYAVDLSSGVEQAPGRKSITKLQAFFTALYQQQ